MKCMVPFRPQECLCASIAIFRIAPASSERALSAQTPLDPYRPFSEPPSYKVHTRAAVLNDKQNDTQGRMTRTQESGGGEGAGLRG